MAVSSILRAYLEGRFGLRAPEQTTEEFLAAAEAEPAFDREQQRTLRAFLAACDAVKFARARPSAEPDRAHHRHRPRLRAGDRRCGGGRPRPPPGRTGGEIRDRLGAGAAGRGRVAADGARGGDPRAHRRRVPVGGGAGRHHAVAAPSPGVAAGGAPAPGPGAADRGAGAPARGAGAGGRRQPRHRHRDRRRPLGQHDCPHRRGRPRPDAARCGQGGGGPLRVRGRRRSGRAAQRPAGADHVRALSGDGAAADPVARDPGRLPERRGGGRGSQPGRHRDRRRPRPGGRPPARGRGGARHPRRLRDQEQGDHPPHRRQPERRPADTRGGGRAGGRLGDQGVRDRHRRGRSRADGAHAAGNLPPAGRTAGGCRRAAGGGRADRRTVPAWRRTPSRSSPSTARSTTWRRARSSRSATSTFANGSRRGRLAALGAAVAAAVLAATVFRRTP